MMMVSGCLVLCFLDVLKGRNKSMLTEFVTLKPQYFSFGMEIIGVRFNLYLTTMPLIEMPFPPYTRTEDPED